MSIERREQVSYIVRCDNCNKRTDEEGLTPEDAQAIAIDEGYVFTKRWNSLANIQKVLCPDCFEKVYQAAIDAKRMEQ